MRHTIIFAIFPSSCASTSICALSVSISSNTSPVANESPSHKMISLDNVYSEQTVCQAFPSPSLTFQLAMFPSVIVGDIAGIVKFCAARGFGALWNPRWELSRPLDVCSGRRALGGPREGTLRRTDRLQSLTAALHVVAMEAISFWKRSECQRALSNVFMVREGGKSSSVFEAQEAQSLHSNL